MIVEVTNFRVLDTYSIDHFSTDVFINSRNRGKGSRSRNVSSFLIPKLKDSKELFVGVRMQYLRTNFDETTAVSYIFENLFDFFHSISQ